MEVKPGTQTGSRRRRLRYPDIFDFVSVKEAFMSSGTNLYVTHNAAKSWQTIAHDGDFGWGVTLAGLCRKLILWMERMAGC